MKRISELVQSLVCCALYAAGLTLTNMFSQVPALFVYLCAFAGSALLFFLCASKFTRRLLLLFAFTAAVIVFLKVDVHGTVTTLFSDLSAGDYAKHERLISAFICSGALLFSFLMSGDEKCVYTLGALAIIWAVGRSLLGGEGRSIHVISVLLALICMYAFESGFEHARFKAMISTGLIAVIIALAVVPETGVENAFLRSAADDCIRFIIKTFNLDRDSLESRRSFDIGSYGWRTLYSSFGGPAYPTDTEVMLVEANETLYLRGSVRYTYNGRAWVDENNTDKAGKIKRYMMSGIEGLLYKDEFRRAFDTDKSSALEYSELKTASVTILGDNLYWAVYTPDRLQSIEFEQDVNLYYNNIGELFAARQLKQGDSYTFTYYSAGDTAAAVLACAEEKDSALASAILMNLEVPQGIDSRLTELVNSLTAGAETKYSAAQAIRGYLRENGTYTLNPGYVPEDADFVSYFVLEDMRGYCTYYAAAMTLMARIAGLPARYVEGYLVTPDENGECTVTGLDAHAWSEVYFSGYGWVTFDATPPRSNTNGDNDGSADEGGAEPEATATPMPTPQPTPTPTPAPSAASEAQATPTPEPDEPSEAPEQENPTPQPRNTPEPEKDNTLGDENQSSTDGNDSVNSLIWLLLLLLLPAAALFVRIRHTAPSYVVKRYSAPKDRLCVWYRASLNCLKAAGLAYMGGDTPVSFAERAADMDLAGEGFAEMSAMLSRVMYAGSGCTNADVNRARRAYEDINRRIGLPARVKNLILRVKNGFGSVDILP